MNEKERKWLEKELLILSGKLATIAELTDSLHEELKELHFHIEQPPEERE